MIITASDGVLNQYINLKSDITIEKAKEILENLYNEDYLGLSYYLDNDDGTELLAFEN